MDIGKSIAKLRTARGMTQEELANRLFVSRDLVSKWETGARRPDYPTAEKIAAALGAPVEELVEFDEYLFSELEECLPEGFGDEEKIAEALSSFLKTLPDRASRLFVLRYYDLKSISETAAAAGMKENQVRSRLSKIRKKLRAFLKEKFG